MPSSKTFDYQIPSGTIPSSDFRVRFETCERAVRSWKEEVYATARTIAETAKKPLLLCFSGGLDSEVMCRAFHDQGIPFSVLTIEHADGTNEHDIVFARYWCKRAGIEQKIIPLDMRTFLENDIDAYIDQGYVTGNVFRYLQIRILEHVQALDGFAIFGTGAQRYAVPKSLAAPASSDIHLEFEIGFAIAREWCKNNATDHEPYFFFGTPELAASYLQTAPVPSSLDNPHIFRHRSNHHLLKRIVYNSAWTELEPRKKYNGFENIGPERFAAENRMREAFGTRICSYRLPISELKEQLWGQKKNSR